MIPAVWYFVHLMGYYVKTSREAKVSAISQLSATSFKPHVPWVGTTCNTGDSARDAKETQRPARSKRNKPTWKVLFFHHPSVSPDACHKLCGFPPSPFCHTTASVLAASPLPTPTAVPVSSTAQFFERKWACSPPPNSRLQRPFVFFFLVSICFVPRCVFLQCT